MGSNLDEEGYLTLPRTQVQGRSSYGRSQSSIAVKSKKPCHPSVRCGGVRTVASVLEWVKSLAFIVSLRLYTTPPTSQNLMRIAAPRLRVQAPHGLFLRGGLAQTITARFTQDRAAGELGRTVSILGPLKIRAVRTGRGRGTHVITAKRFFHNR